MNTLKTILAGALAMGSIPALVVAQTSGAHFQKQSTSAHIELQGPDLGDLIVSWTEAGLGNGDVSYSATGNASAVYFCRTNSGSIPNANNKTTSNSDEGSGGTFQPKNGKVTASLTLEAPAAPASNPPTCGSGQSLDMQSITWTNVVLTDVTSSITFNFTGAVFTHTFYPAP